MTPLAAALVVGFAVFVVGLLIITVNFYIEEIGKWIARNEFLTAILLCVLVSSIVGATVFLARTYG